MRVDFDPTADMRTVDVQASLTALPLRDDSVDVLICYHVLEHIPDDGAAMAEIARTLDPGGLALVQVPWRPERSTDEDPNAPEEERTRRFGQADHVRMYGADFEDRLHSAGLVSYRLTPQRVLGDLLVDTFRLVPDETAWLVRRAGNRPLELSAEAVRLATLQMLVELACAGEYRQAEARIAAAEASAAKWERAYRRIRTHPAIRLGIAVSRPFRWLGARRT
jgi:SAM-dependent methyltransferase